MTFHEDPARPARRPWSEGEILARHRAGAPPIAPVIPSFLSPQQQGFFATLPLVFVAGLDGGGRPCASILRGAPGFIQCPGAWSVEIAASLPTGDPLEETFRQDTPFGLIGVEFATRRRNRVNGRVASAEKGKLLLAVEEAFGNCPKYIFPREIFAPRDPSSAWEPEQPIGAFSEMIAGADAFFIATRGPQGVDISHRGGLPGFVRAASDGTLRVSDYRGNNYFNTFGNLLHDPAAALLFVDFALGTALHLSGEARVDFGGDERTMTFMPSAARRLRMAEALGTSSTGAAPEAPPPGPASSN